MIWDDQKCDVIKIAERIVKFNHIIGEQRLRNDDHVLKVRDEDKMHLKVIMGGFELVVSIEKVYFVLGRYS